MVYADDADTARAIRDQHTPATGGKVVGLYRFPAKDDCTCTGSCSRRTNGGWTRHAKGGHMICGGCGKRHQDTRKRLIGSLLDYLGINLLPRDKTPKLFQNPFGWGR